MHIKLPFDIETLKYKLTKQKIELPIVRTCLGIDIGTASVKIVEISKIGERINLENYGEMLASAFYEKPFRTFQKSTLLLSSQDVAKAIRAIIDEAKMKGAQTIFSIPDFSTFFTTFELPPMSQEELAQAVEYEAHQHVPLPLSDITLDWQVISGKLSNDGQKGRPIKILLVAVPNEVINQYQQIASLASLELKAIEAEVFSLTRAIAIYEQKPIVLIDVGAQTTTISVVENGTIKLSHSFDMGGNEFSQRLAQALQIDYNKAEELKIQQGLEHSIGVASEESVLAQGVTPRSVLAPLIDLIVSEIEKISKSFKNSEKKDIYKIFIAGGSARLPGLAEYIGSQIKEQVLIANPFEEMFYPPILENTLKEMGPSWTVAAGVAQRGFI